MSVKIEEWNEKKNGMFSEHTMKRFVTIVNSPKIFRKTRTQS
jgi:hypothetical protein